MPGRIPENALVFPALIAMAQRGDGCISTTDLIEALQNQFQPTGEDAEILEGRNDTKFSQKVRNLKSHKTLKRSGLADHTSEGFCLTALGRQIANAAGGT